MALPLKTRRPSPRTVQDPDEKLMRLILWQNDDGLVVTRAKRGPDGRGTDETLEADMTQEQKTATTDMLRRFGW